MSASDPAKSRFIVLAAIRWSGALMAIFGLAIIERKIDLPLEAGYVVFIVGLVDALIVPAVLRRRWKAPQ
jgi:hypothetical protein